MRTALIIALLLGACSDPEPPGEVTPVDEPTEPSDEPTEDVTDDPEVTPDHADEAPTALELPEEIPVPDQLPMREERRADENENDSTWPVIAHPDPEVRELLAATIAGVATELQRFAEYGVSCTAPLAHPSLVSVRCGGSFDTRGGTGVSTAALHLAIAGGEVHPIALADVFLPDTDPDALALERCRTDRDRRRAALTEDDTEYWDIGGQCDAVDVVLGRRGLEVHGFDSTTGRDTRLVIPFAELRDRVRSDGPLAPVLSDGAARLPTVAEADATGWGVTAFGPEPALVRRWMDIEPSTAAGLIVDDFGGGLARLVRPGAESEPAREVASALGGEATPLRLGEGSGRLPQLTWDDWWTQPTERAALTLRWVRTTEDLNLRRRTFGGRRSDTVLAVLPAGSLVAAVGGALRQRGQYVRVVTALGAGELASRHLRPHEGCVIGPGETGRHVARVSVRDHGQSRDAWLVLSRHERGARVALHARDDGCELGEELLAASLERPAFDVRLTATDARGGTTLLVVGTGAGRDAPGEVRYRVYRAGSRGALLDQSFELERAGTDLAVRTGETVDDAYYPITLDYAETLHRYAWVDGALAEQAPPAAE